MTDSLKAIPVASYHLPADETKILQQIARGGTVPDALDTAEEFRMAAVVLRGMRKENSETALEKRSVLVKEGNDLYEYRFSYTTGPNKGFPVPELRNGTITYPPIREKIFLVRRNVRTNDQETIPIALDWSKCGDISNRRVIVQVVPNKNGFHVLLKEFDSADNGLEVIKVVAGTDGKRALQYLTNTEDGTPIGLAAEGEEVHLTTEIETPSHQIIQSSLKNSKTEPVICSGRI